MKKLILLILPFILLTSCQITEDVYFNKNGSGTYNLKMNMSGMIQMMKAMVENDSIKKHENASKNRQPEKRDTIILFADILKEKKDSIKNLSKEQRKFLESLRDAKIQIHLDEAKDEMFINYEIPFKKIADLTNIDKKFGKLNAFNKKETKDMNGMNSMLPNYKVTYEFNKHVFHRKVTLSKDQEKKDKPKDDKFYKMINYEIIYHFPYKIESVSYKDALLGADGKSVHIRMPLDSLLKNKDLLNLEVKFR